MVSEGDYSSSPSTAVVGKETMMADFKWSVNLPSRDVASNSVFIVVCPDPFHGYVRFAILTTKSDLVPICSRNILGKIG